MKLVQTESKTDAKLTLKQRKWLDLYLETGNATEAAMRVYKCKNRDVAKSIGCENLTKLDYSEALEGAGITDHLLLTKIREGLDSTKLVGALAIQHPDYGVRHDYVETALKLKRRLDKEEGDKVTAIQIIFGDTRATDWAV